MNLCLCEDKNVCLDCQDYLKKIKDKFNFSNANFDFLKKPKKVFTFTIPVKMDSGEVCFFDGYRVQYNNALGPTKGGIRFHQETNLDEVKLLAFLMALKCSLLGLPFGGAKGGVCVNRAKLSSGELERLSRGFVRETHNLIGPEIDIPAPDVGTDEQVMAWMMDEYSKIKCKFTPAVITGKPVELAGSLGRSTATAMGGAFLLKRLIKAEGMDAQKTTVAIQGFGNVGGNMARILHEWGFKVIAVSNAAYGIFSESGLDIKQIMANQKNGELPVIEGARKISNQELLCLKTDILVPAAISHQINKENAENVKAKIILEMANAPLTADAEPVLQKRGIKIIPDILANAGGVVVSYFEWLQNSSNDYWTEKKVFEKLEKKMKQAFNDVLEFSRKENVDYRMASHALAVRRIAAAEKLHGNS